MQDMSPAAVQGLLQFHYSCNTMAMVEHSISSFYEHPMATIQVRMSDEDKAKAEAVLKEMGMDMTTAVRVYLKRIAVTGGIPFPVTSRRLTVNGFTPEFEAEVLASAEEAKCGKGLSHAFDTAEEAIAYLHTHADSSTD